MESSVSEGGGVVLVCCVTLKSLEYESISSSLSNVVICRDDLDTWIWKRPPFLGSSPPDHVYL